MPGYVSPGPFELKATSRLQRIGWIVVLLQWFSYSEKNPRPMTDTKKRPATDM